MEYLYVAYGTIAYNKAVALRIKAFFKDMDNALALINDSLEEESIHLVCFKNDSVVGTGRLTILENKAIISQMAVDELYKRKGIGSTILKLLIEKSITLNIKCIELSAREVAIPFYKEQGFIAVHKKYPSMKTGVIHQKMIKNLR